MGEKVQSRDGDQRLSVEALRAWEALRRGMFIHFGMSTFLRNEFPDGKAPPDTYKSPEERDVRDWVRIAAETGMGYAVLTAKHVAGHCLWPSKVRDDQGRDDYNVKASGDNRHLDVVGTFVDECASRKIKAGLYYCSWDNHARFGSRTWSDLKRGVDPLHTQYVTRPYEQYQMDQLEELLESYGGVNGQRIHEVWIDMPITLCRDYRNRLYDKIAALAPNALIVMNNGVNDGSATNVSRYAWPTDLITIERALPPAFDENGELTLHQRWRIVEDAKHYLPAEVCDTIGPHWFHFDQDTPRLDDELLGIELIARARGANMLWNVGPDVHGRIPEAYVRSLERLMKRL